LRATFDIGDEYDDESIICKGGETDDLARRLNDHHKTYGKMPGVNLCLKWYNYIDPQYTSKAENDLLHIFGKMGYRFDHPKYKELLIFSHTDSKIVTKQFDHVSKQYIGHITEIAGKLKEMENQLKMSEIKHAYELLKKDPAGL